MIDHFHSIFCVAKEQLWKKTCSHKSQKQLGLILFHKIINIRIVTAALKLQCILTYLMSHPNFFFLRVSLRDLCKILKFSLTFSFFWNYVTVPEDVSCAQQTTLNELEEVLDKFQYQNEAIISHKHLRNRFYNFKHTIRIMSYDWSQELIIISKFSYWLKCPLIGWWHILVLLPSHWLQFPLIGQKVILVLLSSHWIKLFLIAWYCFNILYLAVHVWLTSLLSQFSGELKLKQKGNHLLVKEISISRPQTAASLGRCELPAESHWPKQILNIRHWILVSEQFIG